MQDDNQSAGATPAGRIARDLRAYVDAGTQPDFARKLLAVAAELDRLTDIASPAHD